MLQLTTRVRVIQIKLNRIKNCRPERELHTTILIVMNSCAPISNQVTFREGMLEHFFQQFCPTPGMCSVKDLVHRFVCPGTQYCQIIQCLFIYSKSHLFQFIL